MFNFNVRFPNAGNSPVDVDFSFIDLTTNDMFTVSTHFDGVNFTLPVFSDSQIRDLSFVKSEGDLYITTFDISKIFPYGTNSLSWFFNYFSVDDTTLLSGLTSALGLSSPSSFSSLSSTIITSLENLNSKIDSLDIQIPDDLSSKLQNLSNQVSSLDLTPLSNISLPDSLTGLTPIDITDLDGNFCKFVPGDQVYYGLYGIWEVVKVSLVLVSEDMYTPVYQIKQNISPDGQPPVYRYNSVPQSVLTMYLPPKTVQTAQVF